MRSTAGLPNMTAGGGHHEVDVAFALGQRGKNSCVITLAFYPIKARIFLSPCSTSAHRHNTAQFISANWSLSRDSWVGNKSSKLLKFYHWEVCMTASEVSATDFLTSSWHPNNMGTENIIEIRKIGAFRYNRSDAPQSASSEPPVDAGTAIRIFYVLQYELRFLLAHPSGHAWTECEPLILFIIIDYNFVYQHYCSTANCIKTH